MKIAYTGLDLPEGKMKYHDEMFVSLAEQFQPKKLSPYYFEFIPENHAQADFIAIADKHILDLLIGDIERVEGRLSRTEDADEKSVLAKCLAHLEDERPVCDLPLDNDDDFIVRALGLLSMKPTLVCRDTAPDPNIVCRDVMDKAGMMFFYTVGKQEVHAWPVEKGAAAVTCAGEIHSDLARGFIKAELVRCEDMLACHNLQDARSKGLTQLVDRDHVVPTNSILDIRFNV